MSKVYDGPTDTSSLLLRVSSNTPPVPVQSTSNFMLVTFDTDVSVVSSGFEAVYQTVPSITSTTTEQTTTPVPGNFTAFK